MVFVPRRTVEKASLLDTKKHVMWDTFTILTVLDIKNCLKDFSDWYTYSYL